MKELRQEVKELEGEVHTLRSQTNQQLQVTAAPKPEAGAAAQPQTIGQKVNGLATDLGNLKQDLSKNLGVHIHGLVDTWYGYNLNEPDTANSNGGPNPTAPGGKVNQLRVFDVDANGFNLEQFNLHVDRTSEGGVGFVTDLNFGQVANVLRASTRSSNLNPAAVSNDIIDPTQMYLTYTVPVGTGINLSLGRFVTLLGEEIIPIYNNLDYNISRDFIFGFGIPFTHTGLRANYVVNSMIAVTAGVNNGWDDITDNNLGQTFEGQVVFTPTSSLTLTLTGNVGPEEVNRGNSTRWILDPIVTWLTPIPGLTLINEYMYAEQTNNASVTPLVTSVGNPLTNYPPNPNPANAGSFTITHGVHWQGDAMYVVYDWRNWEFATRGEWFSDPNGARTGLAETLGAFTQDVMYKVPEVSGLIVRLEYRHDESGQRPFFSSDGFTRTGLPVHTYAGQDTFETDVVYAW